MGHVHLPDFDDWLTVQQPFPGYGGCLARVCPKLATSPLGLCARHDSRYRSQGSPGGAKLPSQWANRFERRGLVVPVAYGDEEAFRRWCAAASAVLRPSQVNLHGLNPDLAAHRPPEQLVFGVELGQRAPQGGP